MAKSGDVVENPVSGERVTFLRTAAETGSELLSWEHALRPGARVPYDHIHSVQEERFEVVAGTATVRIGSETKIFNAGDTLVIPAGTAHGLANHGKDELRVLTELRPAMNTEVYFETVFGLARDGKVASNGGAKPGSCCGHRAVTGREGWSPGSTDVSAADRRDGAGRGRSSRRLQGPVR